MRHVYKSEVRVAVSRRDHLQNAGFDPAIRNRRQNIVVRSLHRVFKFSRRPAQVTGYLKHLRRVLFVFQILLIDNSVSPM